MVANETPSGLLQGESTVLILLSIWKHYLIVHL